MFGAGVVALVVFYSTVVSALPSLIHERQDSTSNFTSLEDYEYVVIGSGPGGGPLAARLAIAGHSVLLIDAGDDQGSAVEYQVPALNLASTEYAPMRWDYFVNHYSNDTRQERDSKFTWRTLSGDLYVGASPPPDSTPLGILYPRAGTLGGCGSHNAMITIYPHRSDWTNIQDMTGDESWNPDQMRTYYERLEKSEYLPNGIVGHGFSGWLTTSVTSLLLVLEDLKLLSLIVAAGTAMGNSFFGQVISTVAGLGEVLLRDINADFPGRDSAEGLYQVPLAVAGGARNGPREFILSTANAVNADGSRKYHLDIKLNTLVTKIRFDTSGQIPKAIGVDFLGGPSLYRADPRSGSASSATPGAVNATREVIVAAGSFNTPQLLKLSGIGPKAELQSFNIATIVDLPGVGTNLQDRYETGLVGKTPTDFAITSQCTFQKSSPDPCLVQWQDNPNGDRGTYATNGIAIAMVKKSSVASGDPDILITGAPAYFSGYFPGYSTEALQDAQHWTWITLKAHSRNNAGTITLRSSDPRDMPLINFNSFDTGVTADGAADKDIEAVYEGMELSRNIFSSLIPLSGGFEEVWPGSDVEGDDLKDFIKNEAWGHHACCTAPIGADDDPMAVLDSQFRVRGVQNLRVVDASVFPKIPGYYIALPIYMISEKAADVILADVS